MTTPNAQRDDEPPARLLIHELDGSDRAEIARDLRRSGMCVSTVVIEDRASERLLDRDSVDVAAIKLSDAGSGLVFAADLAQHAPWVQVVFWASEQSPSAGAHVARSLGISRLLPSAQIAGWLTSALQPLVRLARARRAALEAEASIPRMPALAIEAAPTIALPEAERQFRESYLRQLLSESPNAKKAAERAGVPYTTLCSMMKKLGLKGPGRPGELW